MLTIQEWLSQASQKLSLSQVVSCVRDAHWILTEVLCCSWGDVLLWQHKILNEAQLLLADSYLHRRCQREPLAYIFGKVSFLDCVIEVNSSVLIPRQETEILVDRVIAYLKKHARKGDRFLDLCCGSGAIGIAVKKHCPDLNVVLVDVCSDALSVAFRNAQLNHVDVKFVKSDLFENLQGCLFDFIVCNPPYISDLEYRVLESEVVDFEPKKALVALDDGLYFYRKIVDHLDSILSRYGKLWLEMGYSQIQQVRKMFDGVAGHHVVQTDYSGVERFFFLERE